MTPSMCAAFSASGRPRSSKPGSRHSGSPTTAASCGSDGQPCWHDHSLFADERQPGRTTDEDGKRFIESLTRKLGLDTGFIQPGYEDVWYYLWRERRLPVNVDPFDARLDDELERERLRRVFDQGLSKVIGHVLPIKREHGPGLAGGRWVTGPLVLPRRAHVSGPGRFADGLPLAARFLALGLGG